MTAKISIYSFMSLLHNKIVMLIKACHHKLA